MALPNMRRSRSEPAPTRTAPIDDERPLWSGFRHTVALRTVLVKSMLQHLTLEQTAAIRAGGAFPGGNRSSQNFDVYLDVCKAITDDNKARGIPTRRADLPEQRTIIRAAKTYTAKFLQQGHVHDDASNWPGRMVEKHMDTLQELYDIILAGYQKGEARAQDADWNMPALCEALEDDGEDSDEDYSLGSSAQQSETESELSEDSSTDLSDESAFALRDDSGTDTDDGLNALAAALDAETILPFRSVDQVYRMRPRFQELVDNVLKLKTMRGVFNMLKQACPRLRKVVLASTKPRDHVEVQECAKWMMQMPDANGNPTRVKFPPFYKNGEMAEHTAYVHDDDYTFLWKPEWFAKTVYIDAFTVEPEKVISQRKGLWEYGKAKPIVESLIANAAPGSLPHVQAYIIVIPGLGTKVLFPWYGAKGGGADKTEKGGMFEGCEFWFAGSSERVVEWLHEMFYCNQKAGLEKCKQNAPLRYKHMEAAVTADTRVNPDCWMNLQGQPSGALCGSELVCMFDRKVLPMIQATHNPLERETFKEKCVAFAAELGFPAHEWWRITLPQFISLDHDTRHAWVFQRLSAPRVTADKLEELLAETILNVLGVVLPAKQPAAHDLANLAAARDSAAVTAQRAAIMHQYQQHCDELGTNPYRERLWDLARSHPEYMCLVPEQRHPLVPNTPEMNSPAEHMVGAIKGEVREYILDMDPASPLLRRGITYQRMIKRAVQVRGNGERGLHQISRSIAKLPCIMQILAAELNEEVTLHFDFDTKPTVNERANKPKKGNRKKEDTWHELGRAGRWIRKRKWT